MSFSSVLYLYLGLEMLLCKNLLKYNFLNFLLLQKIMDVLSATAEQILSKLHRKQVLNVLYQVCV